MQETFLKIRYFERRLSKNLRKVNLKITFANLYKSIHKVIITPVSSDPLNLEIVERKEKKLQKIEYLENEKSFLDEIKTITHNF